MVPPALTPPGGLCSLRPVGSGYDDHAEPTRVGVESLMAGSECLHRPPRPDPALSGPCPGRVESQRWFLPDLYLYRMAGFLAAGAAHRIRAHYLVPAPAAPGHPAPGLRSRAQKGGQV